MADPSFGAFAAVRRCSRLAGAGAALLAAPSLCLFCVDTVHALCRRLAVMRMDMGTNVYRLAQWASAAAVASWMCASVCVLTWLLCRFLRQALGLPTCRETRLGPLFLGARIVAAVPLLITLIIWSDDEFHLRGVPGAPIWALGLGLCLCAMFAYDVPRLWRNGVGALRARLPLLATPRRELDRLPESGRVRVRGRVVAGERVLAGPGGPCVYLARLRNDVSDHEHIEALPFVLADRGRRAWIDVDPARLLGAAVEGGGAPRGEAVIPVGAEVEVIGEVTSGGAGGAYRAGEARLGAGEHPLLVLSGACALHRRLVLAAIVELLGAAGLGLCVAGLVAFWAYLGVAVRLR